MTETSPLEPPELVESINYFLFVSALVGEKEAPRELHFYRTKDQALMALNRLYDALEHTTDRPSTTPGLSRAPRALDAHGRWAHISISAVNPDRPRLVVRLQEVTQANVEFKDSGDRFGLETQMGWDPR